MSDIIYFGYFGIWNYIIGITYDSNEKITFSNYNYEEDNV